jgi:hypothetical protein
MTSDIPPTVDVPAADPIVGAVVNTRTVPGPGAVAGAFVFATALQRADIDPQTQARLLEALGDTLPLKPLQPGTAATDRTLPATSLRLLIPSAAVVAAGLDPAALIQPAPPVLWSTDAGQLLVRIAEVHADLTDGAIVITLPVTCDQTGPVDVTVTFITGSPDQPTGGVATAEDHPRGPEVVVENWAEPLVALAWHTLVIAIGAMSGAGGNDFSGRDLISASFAVSKDGLTVTPMARHTFLAGHAP